MRRRILQTGTSLLLLLLAISCARTDETIQIAPDGMVVITSTAWTLRIDPARLHISAQIGGNKENTIVVARSPEDIESEVVTNLTIADGVVSWEQPSRSLSFVVTCEEDVLRMKIRSAIEQRLEWPVTGVGPEVRALIVPESEGLYIPLNDEFWREQYLGQCRSMWGGLLPFWGIETDEAMLAYWLSEDLRSHLCWIDGSDARLALAMVHDFLKRDGLPDLELRIALAPDSPIGPALVYRDWLVAEGRHVTLADKIACNPEVAKLQGAMHGYLWGDGRTPEMIAALHKLGVERAFLSYDQDPREEEWLVDAETIAAAVSRGYLIGPYDTYNNVQDPGNADAASSVFNDELYRHGGVKQEDGKPAGGFRGRGHHLSSEALKRADRDFVAERIEEAIDAGANAYFLDVDATGELYDDYDPAHPMTITVDRNNRLQRMGLITDHDLVLGSESTSGWATPAIHVSHGTLTPKSPRLWEVLRDRKLIGGYWPPKRPSMHFKEIVAPEDLARLTFDPRFRLPLFEAVFHDAVVATDFWGVPLPKFKDLVNQRSLLLMLYNVPAVWHLDQQVLRDHADLLSKLDEFFSPLHRRLSTEPLTDFEWLTPDRLVQRTRFSDVVVLTANFGTQSYGDIPPMCIVAEWLDEDRKEWFCPAD